MRSDTNKILIGFLLLVAAMWGAAQFVSLLCGYSYRPDAVLQGYHRSVSVWFANPGIKVGRNIPSNDDWVYKEPLFFAHIGHVGNGGDGSHGPWFPGVRLANWRSGDWTFDGVYLPYWFLALVPALCMAWPARKPVVDAWRADRVLCSLVLLILGMWGAAQFGSVYCYREWATATLGFESFRGGLELFGAPGHNGPKLEFWCNISAGSAGHVLSLPRLRHGVGVYGTLSDAFVPYWLLALPPAAWLAQRWRRARKARLRGFDVVTASQ